MTRTPGLLLGDGQRPESSRVETRPRGIGPRDIARRGDCPLFDCARCGLAFVRYALTRVGGRLICPTCLSKQAEREITHQTVCSGNPCTVQLPEAPF